MPSQSSLDKQVGFQDIEILEFHYILGDNPAVTSGCPIALGTELVQTSKCDVDTFEQCRASKRKHRKKLVMPVPTRAQILLERGYTIDQIADGTIAAEQARQERYQSNTSQKWDKMNEISERFGRVLRKALPGNGQKMTVVANSA